MSQKDGSAYRSMQKCIVFVESATQAAERILPYAHRIEGVYPFISAVGISVSADNLSRLSRLRFVKAVVGHTTVTTFRDGDGREAEQVQNERSYGSFCGGKTGEPCFANLAKQLQSLHEGGVDGRGVTCAVIDSGITPHLDFCVPKNRIIFHDFQQGRTAAYDDNGHGTAVAGILGGNGLTGGRRIIGVAPKCEILSLKSVGENGEGSAFKILEAMQWIYANRERHRIRVLNLSFGSDPTNQADPLCVGAEALWRAGITVVVSAGNSGPKSNTVKSPGISPTVITVGGAACMEGGVCSAADFSSRGPAGAFHKPDLIAPSEHVDTTAVLSPYTFFSGTSMAAPMVSGVCALLLQKHPDFTPDKVKEVLLTGAKALACDSDTCGRGLLSLDFFDSI